MPNFRAVNAGVKLPPQSVKEKLKTGGLERFDYSSFIFVGIQAGISQATDAYPAFRQGAAGYGRYYWHTFADNTDENLWVEGILPIVLHQDSRYYTLGHGGIIKRGFYAVTRTMITRTDSGQGNLQRIRDLRLRRSSSDLLRLLPNPVPHVDKDWTALADQCAARFWHIRGQGVLARRQPRDFP